MVPFTPDKLVILYAEQLKETVTRTHIPRISIVHEVTFHRFVGYGPVLVIDDFSCSWSVEDMYCFMVGCFH